MIHIDYSPMNTAPSAPLRSDGRGSAPMTLPSAASFFATRPTDNVDAFASAADVTKAAFTTARLTSGRRQQSNISFERHSMSLFDDIVRELESEEEEDDTFDEDDDYEDDYEYDEPSPRADNKAASFSTSSIVGQMEEEILAKAARNGKVAYYVSDDNNNNSRGRRHVSFLVAGRQNLCDSLPKKIVAPNAKKSNENRSFAQDDIVAALETLVEQQNYQKNSIGNESLGNEEGKKKEEIHPLDITKKGSDKGMAPPRSMIAAARSLSAEMTKVEVSIGATTTGRSSLRMPLEHFAQ